jgi:YfiH family protein
VDVSFRLADDGLYRCQAFQQFIWQAHGFGTRRANPPAAVTLRQIHSDLVLEAHGLKDREQEGDALITNQTGLRIAIRTADCVPILLLDSAQRAIAAVHAGWRGTAAEIVRCAMHKMFTDFGSKPVEIWAAIGPSIRECCYEVGQEVASRFEGTFPEWTGLPQKQHGKRNLNLAEANIRQLRAAGVPHSQIFDSCLCTACNLETFYSFRREPQEPGRLTSAILRIS